MSTKSSGKKDQQQGSSRDARPPLREKPKDKHVSHERVRNQFGHLSRLEPFTKGNKPTTKRGIWLNTIVKTREINMMIEGEAMVVPRIKGNPKEMANKKLDLDTLSGITHWDIFKVVREHPRTANCNPVIIIKALGTVYMEEDLDGTVDQKEVIIDPKENKQTEIHLFGKAERPTLYLKLRTSSEKAARMEAEAVERYGQRRTREEKEEAAEKRKKDKKDDERKRKEAADRATKEEKERKAEEERAAEEEKGKKTLKRSNKNTDKNNGSRKKPNGNMKQSENTEESEPSGSVNPSEVSESSDSDDDSSPSGTETSDEERTWVRGIMTLRKVFIRNKPL